MRHPVLRDDFKLATFISPNAVKTGRMNLIGDMFLTSRIEKFAVVGQGNGENTGEVRDSVLSSRQRRRSKSAASPDTPELEQVEVYYIITFRWDGGPTGCVKR